MTPQQLREKNQKTVTGPTTETEFQIRRLTFLELNEARFSGILGESSNAAAAKVPEAGPDAFMTAARAAAMGERMEAESVRYILLNGVVSPPIIFAEAAGLPVPDGSVDARWISEDLKWLINEVLDFSGFNEKASKKVEDLTKNDRSSESQTVLPAGTEDSLTK